MFKRPTRRAVQEFLCEEDAATAVEYAVMLSLILAACMASVAFLADKTKESFDSSGAAISGAWGN